MSADTIAVALFAFAAGLTTGRIAYSRLLRHAHQLCRESLDGWRTSQLVADRLLEDIYGRHHTNSRSLS